MDRDLKKQIRAARIAKPRLQPKPPDIKGNVIKLLLFYLWHALINSNKNKKR